ncbi:monocarboxylate transporter 12-B-like [Macrobrachium nipponense]|uniref:monocarboxylate transporter 12-B-like n=1 Tax=Macrobrachium nipponense TaxID=159736 RepID=UPI0030C86576
MKEQSGTHEAIVPPAIPPENTANNENDESRQENSPSLQIQNGPETDSNGRHHNSENGTLIDGKYDSVRYCPDAPEKNEELLKMLDKSEDERGSEKLIASSSQQESKTQSVVAEEDMAPDGGWGWVVVAAASFVLMSVDTIGQCFGIIFSGFLLDRGASSLTTAWMINMFTFFFCVTGLPLASLIQEFGWRRIALVASLMLFTATVSSAFANAIWVLYFTFSLLAGISCGMLLNISYIIVPYYFNRRRGLASGIIMALDSSGQIVAPPLVKWLQDEFAYKGATLILGGIVLNCFVAAAAFHPVEWHSKLGPRHERRATQVAQSSDNGKSRWVRLQSNGTQFLASMLANLRVLKYVRAVVIALGATLFLCGYQNFMAFMPFVVQDAGYTLGDAAQCVSVSAVFNMITRLTVAWLSDSSWFSYRVSLMFSSAVLTVTLIVFSLLRDIKWMIALMCIYGIGVGSYMCLFSLVMVHYFGLDKLVSMMGATMLVTSVSNITIGPMAGLVRDLTGSYSACIWVLAGLSFCSFLLWFFMPLAVRFDDGMKKKKRKKYANDV